MRNKRWIVMGLMFILLGGSATPSMAMDAFDRIWLRDALIGGGVGLGLGLVSRGSGGWLVLGLVAGGIFGYFDAKDHLVGDALEPPSPWTPSLRISVETRPIFGREQPVQILKATLYQARW